MGVGLLMDGVRAFACVNGCSISRMASWQSVPYPAKSQPEVWSEILHIRDAQLLTPI